MLITSRFLSWINPPAWQRESWPTALLHPKGMARMAFPAPGHPQSLSGNISLLFQPPEHVALAQAENPRCPVLGADSRGSGQLCPRCGAASPGEQTFPHSTSTSLDRCASSTPALLLTPHLPRAGTNHISTSSADLSSPPPVQSHPLPAVTALWWHTRLWSHFSRR